MSKLLNSKIKIIIDDFFNIIESKKKEIDKLHKFTIKRITYLQKKIYKTTNHMDSISSKVKNYTIELNLYKEKITGKINKVGENNKTYKDMYENIHNNVEELILRISDLESEYMLLLKKRNKMDLELLELNELKVDIEGLTQVITVFSKYSNNDLSNMNSYLKEKEVFITKIMKTTEKEKQSISRDIHDGPAQTLAFLILKMQLLKAITREECSPSVVQGFEEIDKYLKSALEEIRYIMHDLRPMSLDNLGIIATMEQYVQDFNSSKGISTTMDVVDNDNLSKGIPIGLCYSIFRIFQEGLNNIYRHSNANSAHIFLEIYKNSIKLIIKDNGKGFDVNSTQKLTRTTGQFGLLGMQERVALLNGNISISSSINKGVQVEITIPWDSSIIAI